MLLLHFLAALCVSAVFAAETPNYSGTYSREPQKGKSDSGAVTLRVVQNEDAIEITRIENGRTTISRFPLDGSEGIYTMPGGVVGKGKARFKGRDLLLECDVLTFPPQSTTPVRMHVKERWQLSTDQKMLTIHGEISFPDYAQLIHGATDRSWTEKYTRTDNP